jgi:hypothetical protein
MNKTLIALFAAASLLAFGAVQAADKAPDAKPAVDKPAADKPAVDKAGKKGGKKSTPAAAKKDDAPAGDAKAAAAPKKCAGMK